MPVPVRHLSARCSAVAAALCGAALALTGCGSGGQGTSSPSAPASTTPTACSTHAAPALTGDTVPFGTAAPTGPSSALQVGAGAPQFSAIPSDQPGYRLVRVPIRASVRTNGTFAVDHSQFLLVDRAGRGCAQPAINPLDDGFVALTVDESHAAAGSVAFLVPSSTMLSRLSVRYLPAAGAGSASLAWKAGAATPSATAPATGCDGAASKLSTRGSTRKDFGATISHGDSVVSQSVRASTPTRRAFTPGPTQPNDMDAIDITLHVTATGADTYVDRRSFVLIDGSGRRCRSNTALGSQGETLTSALVKKGHSHDYRIVFWAPKGSAVHGLRLVQLATPGGTKARSVWSDAELTLQPLPH